MSKKIKTALRLFTGLAISGILLYLCFRNIKFDKEFFNDIRFNYLYLIPVILSLFLVMLIRAYRLKVIFSPIQKLSYRQTISYNCIGYMFIYLLPLRLGELIIPTLIKKDTSLPISSSIAVIFIERMIDFITLLCILLYVFINMLLPKWLLRSGLMFAIIIIVTILFFAFCYFNSPIIKQIIQKILPGKVNLRLLNILKRFKQSLMIIKNPYLVIYLFLISFIVWLSSSVSIFFIFQLAGLRLPFFAAVALMVINSFGVSIPAGPAMIGTFQYSCIIALSLFSIDKNDSFIFANLYYILGIGLTIILGVFFSSLTSFSIREYLSERKLQNPE